MKLENNMDACINFGVVFIRNKSVQVNGIHIKRQRVIISTFGRGKKPYNITPLGSFV